MKKLLLLISFTALMFAGCKEDNVDPKDDPNSGIKGCMDSKSLSFNPDATVDDGSCKYLTTTTTEKRTVVLEEYTGVKCTYCPDGHRRAQSFADAHPGEVVLINVHTGGYATPSAGWLDFTTNFGNALATKSGMGLAGTGYPGGSVSRNTFAGEASVSSYKMASGTQYTLLNRGGWWNTINSTSPAGDIILSKDAPVNVGMKVISYNEATREVKLAVELYFTETLPNGAKLNVALLESNVVGKQIDGATTNANYVHKHMLRDMLTGQWGETIDPGTTIKGTRMLRTFSYILATTDKNNKDILPENCDFAAFISSSSTSANADNNDILNASEISLK